MSVNDNLTVLNNELEEIREALHNKGVEVGCDMTGYAEAIDAIDTNMLKSASAEAFDVSKSPVQTFSVRSTSNGPSATADYDPETKHIHFTFGLVPGPAGRDGVPGVDGAPGERGEQGAAGKDGSRFEYIYRATNTPFEVTDFPELKEIVDRDRYVPTGWSDNPQGVTEGLEWEYTSHREKEDGHWGAWSTPVVWSHFGTTGKDGNGIEYIFCSTKDMSVIPPVPYSDPNSEENPEMFPLKTWKDGVEYLWWDDPQETNETWTICWSSLRKQSYENDVQKWGAYTNPVVWSRYAKDGKEGGGRTVQIYTRDDDPNANIDPPTGGFWDPETNNVDLTETGNFATTDGRKWSTNPNDSKGLHIWQSNCTFNSAGTPITDWCEPFRITGDNGEAGADGTSVEFIYRLLADKNDYNSLLDFHTNSGLKLEITDTDTAPSKIDNFVESNIPDETNLENWQFVDGMYTICETDWTDQPQGIDGDRYLLEVVCSRKFDKKIGKWGEWTIPTIWSMWGEDGMDGDGVEYIYCVTPKKDEDGEIMAGHPLLIIPSREVYELNGKGEEYQKPDFVPGRDFTLIGENGWTDEPQDVSPEQPVEWVSVRKKRKWKEDDKEATWGDFSTPKKWAMWSTDGNSFKTGYAFAVSYLPLDQLITNPSVISGGSYEIPIPDETIISVNGQRHVITWFDTVPSGGDQKSLWMVNRTFMSGEANPDSEDSTDQYWTLPCRMSDRTDFQVEYSKGFTPDEGKTFDENQRPYPNSFQKYFLEAPEGTNPEDKHDAAEQNWRVAERAKGFIWDDYVEGAVWMLTSTFKNGEWSAWSVIRIKGEKGDKGVDGTSVDIKGTGWLYNMCPGDEGYRDFFDDEHYYPEEDPSNFGKLIWNILLACDSENDGILEYTLYQWDEIANQYRYVDPTTLSAGDGYMIKGDLWIWNGHNWENAGQIKGDPGELAYLYIAYSNNPMVLEIGTDGVDDFILDLDENGNLALKSGKYCGYRQELIERNAEFLSHANVYTWSKWIGDDGWGWEQIFLLTNGSDFSWDNGPNIESLESKAEKGFRPEHNLGNKAKGSDDDVTRWSDGPLTPTAEYPYCWVCIREASTAGYGDWKNLSLYTQYASSADHLELSEDQITVPVEANEQPDTEWTGVDLTAILYSGSSIVDQENVKYEYSINGEEWTPNEGNVFTFNRDFFVENAGIQKIYFKVTFNTFEFKKVCHVFWSKVGYELNVSKTIVRKNLYDGGYPEDDVIEVRLRKWDFRNNVWKTVDDCNVWAQYYYVDPDDQAEYGKDPESAVTKTGTATFDISDKVNLEKIKFYATIDGKSDSEIIAFEEVGVIANGLDGNSIEYIYFLTDDENIFDVASNYFTPEAWLEDSTYQDSDYIPTSQGWTDVPSGVSEEKPYEFVSVRKHEQDTTGMKWSEFTHPILWAKYGRDAGTCAFSTGTAIVSFVNKELSIDRVVDTINLKKASNSVEITSVSAKTMYVDNVEVENANDWPIKVNWTGEYCGFIFNEITLPQSDTSYKPCVIDVDVEVQSTIGTFVIRKTIILQQGGGESKFSIDLTNEFFYLFEYLGKVDVNQWPSQGFYAYYGGNPIYSITKIQITAESNGKTYDLGTETLNGESNSNLYTIHPNRKVLDPLLADSNIREITCTVTATASINDKEYTTIDTILAKKSSEKKPYLQVQPSVINLKDNKKISWFIMLPDTGGTISNAQELLSKGYSTKVKVNGNVVKENEFSYDVENTDEVLIQLYDGDFLLDQEPVTVIDITNPYLLDLSPDHEYIDTDGSGEILDESTWPTVKCTLWNGSNDVTSDTTFGVIPNDNNIGVWESNGVYKLKGMSGDTMELTFTGKYNGVTVSKVFKAVKSFGKVYYKIILSSNSINASRNANNKITVTFEKIDGKTVTPFATVPTGTTFYVNGQEVNSTSFTVSDYSSGSLEFVLKDSESGEIYDKENVVFVFDGLLDEVAKQDLLNQAKNYTDSAKQLVESDLESAKTELQGAIDNKADSNTVANLSTKVNNLEWVDDAVTDLQGFFVKDEDGNVSLNSKVSLDEDEVAALSLAALGADAKNVLGNYADPDNTYTNSVWAQSVISLVGKYVTLKAEQITAGYISASRIKAGTISATKLSFDVATMDDIPDVSDFATKDEIPDVTGYITDSEATNIANNAIDNYNFEFASETALNTLKAQVEKLPTEERVTTITKNTISTGYLDAWGVSTLAATSTINTWALNADGSGHIAGGKLEWTADGTIIAQPDVTITWADVEGKPTDLMTTSTQITENQISTGLITANHIDTDTLKAKDILADVIVGKTFKSSDDNWSSWEINSDGSARFGGFASGDMHSKFNSDGSGYIGNGMISWNTSSNTIVIRPGGNNTSGSYITACENATGFIIGYGTTLSCPSGYLTVTPPDNISTAIYADGPIYASDGFFQSSDERLKDFQKDVVIDFEKLKTIPKKYFTWKEDGSKLQIGTSAQKIQELYPELVIDGDTLGVDYARLSMIALAAIDKLYDELVEVKKQLNNLTNN